jgi:hypothetical protein
MFDLLKYIDDTVLKYSAEPKQSFSQGGSVTTPKRGLVDEAGSYAGKGQLNPPNPSIPKESVEEFIAQQGVDKWEDVNAAQRARFNRDVGERIKQFKKDAKGLISRQELADLIGLDNDYLRAINKSGEYKGGRNPKYQLISEILGESTKIYRPVSGYNMGYYKKPSAADIKKIKKILDADILNQKVIDRVNTLTGNKEFMNMLKNKNLTDENFLPKVKSMFPNLDLTDKKLADTILLIARGSEGANLTGIDLKSDKGLSKKLLKQFETAKWGNPFHAAAYKYASTKIDEQLGSKVGTFKNYQASINKKLKDLDIDTKNYNIDEFVGVSIGGKQEAAPYSVFTQITDAKYNQGPAAAYQGKLSQASTKLSNIINQYGSDSKEAKDLVKNFNNTTALNHEKKYNAKVAKLDLRTPEESFGKKRFNQLGTMGDQIKTSFEEKGFGYKIPKDAMTQKEVISSEQNIKNFAANVPESESKKIAQNLRKAGFKCKFDKGGLALCDNPADYAEDITRQAKLAADKNPAAINKFKNAGNIVRKGISGLSKTGVAAIGELLFAFPFGVMDYTDGLSFQRIIGNATLGLFGQTEKAEIRSYSGGHEALKAKNFAQKATDLEDITNKETEVSAGNIMLSPDDMNLLPSQVEGAEKRFLEASDYYSGPDGYERFLKDLDNEQKIIEEVQEKKSKQRSLERKKNVQKSLEGV